MNIQLEDQTIYVHVVYGKRGKLSIHIESNGHITVKAPSGASDELIEQAVKRHGGQIVQKLRQIERATQAPAKLKEYEHEGKFLHLGQYCYLHELIETKDLTEEQLRTSLKKFYISSCKQVINERIKPFQAQLKVSPKAIAIVESRTKWGSCSSDRNLTFNYLLAMAPVEVIDYVIVHELCHLLHMNHDRSFWRRVGGIMPDYKDKEKFLERYGHAMTL